MLILLPPSETKRTGGVVTATDRPLQHHQRLSEARSRVRSALEHLSRDDDAAAKSLKLGVKARGEIAHNRALGSSGLLPAGERYSGVLYDALDVPSLDTAARDWLDTHVAVQSALFGLISVADEIPAYRLSASSRLPALEGGLKAVWRDAHVGMNWSAFDWVLDLRSKDYAALAPLPEANGSALHVAQRSASGEVRALNHFNKSAKGDLVRRLAQSQAQVRSESDLIEWAKREGLALNRVSADAPLTLVTELGVPGGAQL